MHRMIRSSLKQSKRPIKKSQPTWENLKHQFALPYSPNSGISKQFLAICESAITTKKKYSFLMDIKNEYKKIKNHHVAPRSFFDNIFDLEKNAITKLRTLCAQNDEYGESKEIRNLIEIYDGLPALRRTIFADIKARQNGYYAEMIKSYQDLPQDMLLDILNKKVALLAKAKKGRIDLNECDQLELKTEIRALRKVLHPTFSAVVITNRAGVALKIAEISSKLAYETVLIASEKERYSLAARAVDQFIPIDNPNSIEETRAAINLYKKSLPTGYDCGIHPGYGYLSENHNFSKDCEDNGDVFIGPAPAAMEALGDKAKALQLAREAGIPVLEGYHGENQDPEFLLQQFIAINGKAISKKVDGGGGTGNVMLETVEQARAHFKNLQPNKKIILEKFLENFRHLEVQVEINNGVLILGVRDCTLQRKNQKIIEIAFANTDEYKELIDYAFKYGCKAKQAGYKGVATFEFLKVNGKYYFIECNPRLQVEHIVTEQVAGSLFNTIELQLNNASKEDSGEYLRTKAPHSQKYATSQDLIDDARKFSPIQFSVELRINAAKPEIIYKKLVDVPAQGRITKYVAPLEQKPNEKKRGSVESSIEIYSQVDVMENNPNIMLICGFGKTLEEAFANVTTMLNETIIEGIPTNIEYLKFALEYLKMNGYQFDSESCKQIDALYYEKLMNRPEKEANQHLRML